MGYAVAVDQHGNTTRLERLVGDSKDGYYWVSP